MLARKDVSTHDSIFEKVKFIGKEMRVETRNKGLLFFLLENPNEILGDVTKKEIFDDFYPVALSAFNRDDTDYFREDVYSHLFNGSFLILVFDPDNKNLGVAFRSYAILKHNSSKILYIGGTAVTSNYQSCGIYQGLTREMSKKVDFVASRTQNPIVVTALSRVFQSVYPVTTPPNKKIKVIANVVAEYLEMNDYNYDEMIGYKTYGQSLTGFVLKANSDLEAKFLKTINPENGDCLLLICPV